MIRHFNRTIPGWCDFEDFYRDQVARLPSGSHVVETGIYLGRSTAFLATEIINSGKTIRFDAIDTFEGIPEDVFRAVDQPADVFDFSDQETLRGADGTLFDAVVRFLQPVADQVNLIRRDASQAAAQYADASLDVVFLDDDHNTPHVFAELLAWWPKLKPGGVLAGHDYDWPDVCKAVELWSRRVGRPVQAMPPRSWCLQKPTAAESWTVPPEARRCLVAVCCNERNVPTRTVESLIRLGWGDRATAAAMANGFEAIGFTWESKRLHVSDLRDDAMYKALAEGYSHVLFLDADMLWPVDVLTRMLAHHAKGIVAGIYYLKHWPYWPVGLKNQTWNPVDLDYDYTYDAEAAGCPTLRAEDLVGMGCTLVPVELARRFERPWFKYQQTAMGHSAITEDVWFCQQAKALGCPIWLDPTIVCHHISQEVITSAHFDRATFEMAMLSNGQRLSKTKPVPAGESSATGSAA